MRVTERDMKISKAIHDFGCLTTSQIAGLFGMDLKVCQRRLRKLLRGDYLRKVSLPGSNGRNPYLFYLGDKSEPLIGVSGQKPRLTLKLSHQMKNTDVLISIINAFKERDVCCKVLPEHIVRKDRQEVIPDGAFMLKKNGKSALFLLENCAGTEIIRSPSFNQDVETKIIRYVEMFEGNNVQYYENHFGCSFRRFRLLFIANDLQRLKSISKVIKDHDIHGFVYISTLNEFNKQGIHGRIWDVPAKNKTMQSIV